MMDTTKNAETGNGLIYFDDDCMNAIKDLEKNSKVGLLFLPGDVVVNKNTGEEEYLFLIDEWPWLATNACSKSWIERGLRYYGQELYPFYPSDYEDYEFVEHAFHKYGCYGSSWYASKDEGGE